MLAKGTCPRIGALLFAFADKLAFAFPKPLLALPRNRKPQKVNVWMGGWAPLPQHVDLPRYEEIQQEWNQRDCHVGVMSRLWRWLSSQ